MITRMNKVFIAVSDCDQIALINKLRDMGVLHLVPVDPDQAVARAKAIQNLKDVKRAVQLLSTVEPSKAKPKLAAIVAAKETISVFHEISELSSRLSTIEQSIIDNQVWGTMRLEDLKILEGEAGLNIRLYRIPKESMASVKAACIMDLGPNKKTFRLVALAYTEDAPPELPAGTETLEVPQKDIPTMQTQADDIREELREFRHRAKSLANLASDIEDEAKRREKEIEWFIGIQSGLFDENLYAISGWMPADQVESLSKNLENDGIIAAIRAVESERGEDPPTEIRTHKWIKPIEGLFNILGTKPGYREFDTSAPFLIALPIFSAMLIADGGYGLLLFIVAAIFYKKMSAKFGKPLTQLTMIIGGVSIIWGFAISSFFGFGDQEFIAAGGMLKRVGIILAKLKLIEGSFTADSVVRDIMRLSFVIGTIHMSLGHLWRAARYFPSLKALANVGWAIFLWGMLMVVQTLVLELPSPAITPYLLGLGALLVIGFTNPQRNLLKTVGYGLANLPLSALSTLSDTISYIRLMAVGLASTILASTFNGLAVEVASNATWFAGALVLLIGHGLNIGLAIIALFAHGVRLNMLEFSQCLGMAWNGTAYKPFSNKNIEEI